MSALRELYLSHNLLRSIQGNNLLGLEELHVLTLDHNLLTSLPPDLFSRLTQLRELSLQHNHLARLEPDPGSGHLTLQRVSLQHNSWACSNTDCHWVTLILDTFNKTAIADISEVSPESNQAISGNYFYQINCQREDGKSPKRLQSFMSSCTNLDVLPVAAQTSSPSTLVIATSVTIVIILTVLILGMASVILRRSPPRPPVTVYLHYSMSDDGYVRREVAAQLSRVTRGLCYHHGDTSTQLSVGGAMAGAVQSSGAAVILASPAYIQSCVTGAELHILADCVLHKFSYYPVIVLVTQDTSFSIEEVEH